MQKIHLKEITEAEFIELGGRDDYSGWTWVC